MKIRYYDLNFDFELRKDQLNFLIMENPRELEKIVIALYYRLSKKESRIELMEELDKLDFSKQVELMISPMDFSYDKREIQKKLLEDLIDEIHNSELMDEFTENCAGFLESIEALKMNMEYELDFDDNIGINMLLKSFGIKLKEPEGSFTEKLIDYTKNIYRLLGKRVFILISCCSYIQDSEFQYLLEHAKYLDIVFLFVEPRQRLLTFPMNQFILDVDLCEIHD